MWNDGREMMQGAFHSPPTSPLNIFSFFDSDNDINGDETNAAEIPSDIIDDTNAVVNEDNSANTSSI